MKINIFLTNFVFVTVNNFFLFYIEQLSICYLKDPSEAPWVDSSIVGDPNFPTYQGQEVIVATPTITTFRNYMESKSFPFEYDHAMALFKFFSLKFNSFKLILINNLEKIYGLMEIIVQK